MVVPRVWRERVARYRMVGKKCPACGKVYFPPRDVCPTCHRESYGKMEDVELSGRGKVYSYTVVYQNVLGYELQKPYIMAIVEMEEGPRVTGQIVDCRPEDVEIGMPVRAVFRRLGEEGKDGVIVYGYKFVPDL